MNEVGNGDTDTSELPVAKVSARGWADDLAWMTRTKLAPPVPPGDLIPRPHLCAALRRSLTARSLTLLSAPAGYGKTSLATLAVRDLSLPVAWLSLDERDNDLPLFLAYLVAAIDTVHPEIAHPAYDILSALPNPAEQPYPVIRALLNGLVKAASPPFVLLLDDLYRIVKPPVYAVLTYLLEHLPPQMHLAIGTRYDPPLPLARLRAQGQLTEFRPSDLGFTSEETAAFLNGTLFLGLSDEDLTLLHRRVGGWPAGVRLLAGSLARIPSPAGRSAFIADFARTDRYIFDFLADEVLNHQPEPLRTFILETSILSELTAPLCNAVTGRGDAADLLADLTRRNLLLSPTPPFTYHPLFADFLRRRLSHEMPGRVQELHRRAALALADVTPERAIAHYLAAGMWDEAIVIIARLGEPLLRRGMLDTLSGWIERVPATLYDANPVLPYLLGRCAWRRGDIGAARALLEQARSGFEAAGDETGQGQSLALLANCALIEVDIPQGNDLLARALTFPLPPREQVRSLMNRAWLELLWGDLAQAATDFEHSVVLGDKGESPLNVLLEYLSPLFIVLPSGLEQMERVCHRATSVIGRRFIPPRVHLGGLMAFVHLWRGRIEPAIRSFEDALAVSERLGGFPALDADLAAPAAIAYLLRGDDEAADRVFDTALGRGWDVPLEDTFRTGLLYLRGRADLNRGRLDAARRVYAEMETSSGWFELSCGPTLRAMMQALIELHTPPPHRDLDAAERHLRRTLAESHEQRFLQFFGSPRLVLARLHLERGEREAARREFLPLLAACEREHTPGRVLMEGSLVVPLLRLVAEERDRLYPFATRLLTLLGAGGEPHPIAAPLTSRELEVLRLIAAGHTNRAIAARLVISEHTVKSHVVHILRKLDVATRTQAAARAREQGLL